VAYFKDIFAIALEAKVSLVGLLAYMYVFFKEEYILYVNSYKDYPNFGMDFKEMFPQFVKHLKDGAGHYKSLDMLGTHVNVNFLQKDDAYAWLGIGRELLAKDEVVYNTLLDNIKAIYEANPTVGKELAKRMLQNGRKLDYQIKLKEEVPTAIDDNLLYNRAFELIKYNSRHPYYADAPDYLKFFPFTEWKEDNAKYALKRIVLCEKLPLERLDELSGELKDFVMSIMEAQSQLNALSYHGKVAELVELQLYPEVEIALLRKPDFWEVHILKYVEKYGLSQEAYEFLLKGFDWDTAYRKIISVYAQKNGLTQKQYMQLMQSVRCSLAPFVKQYVKQ
jgi:GNAT superfamily N-acetyltransferase